MPFNIAEYKQLRDNFDSVVKRIPATGTVSPFSETRERQATDSIQAYNLFVAYIQETFSTIVIQENRDKVNNKLTSAREKLVRLLARIGYQIDLEGLGKFDTIDLSRLSVIVQQVAEPGTSASASNTAVGQVEEVVTDDDDKFSDASSDKDTSNRRKETETLVSDNNRISLIMAPTPQEKRQIQEYAAKILDKEYNGDPLLLESFIDKVNIISEGTPDDMIAISLGVIKAKLTGRARDSIPTDCTTFAALIDNLRKFIRPDDIQIVKSRLVALRLQNNNYTEFAKKAEDLADSLFRALVDRRTPEDVARESVILETKVLCRANARTEGVKTIITGGKYKDAKECIAEFTLVSNMENNEKKANVFAFKQDKQNNRGNHYGNNSGNRGKYNNRGRGNFNNNNNNGFQNIQNNRGNYHGNRGRGGNYRGRGNFNVRVAQALNELLPQLQQMSLGATQQNQRSSQPQITMSDTEEY